MSLNVTVEKNLLEIDRHQVMHKKMLTDNKMKINTEINEYTTIFNVSHLIFFSSSTRYQINKHFYVLYVLWKKDPK